MLSTLALPVEESVGAPCTEGVLVQAAQADPAAFAPLYQRYRDRIYAYLRTRTRNEEDAADLTQQVFVQALAGLPRYHAGQIPIAAWLARIAHNLAANYHRQHRHTLTWDFLPEALQPIVDEDPAAQLVQREATAHLNAVLQTCNATTREILALHYAARLTIAETAAAVGKSEAAVKKQLTRTLRALKEKYHESSHQPLPSSR
jgi:RNA polymerase sigma-70 factor (ECF subfamily)